MVCFEYLATDVGGLYFQFHIVVIKPLFSYFLQFIESFFAITRFMPAGLRHTTHPFQLSAIQIVGTGYFNIRCIDTLLTFLQVIAIISLILIDLTIVYFNDFGTDTVEEVTVVRHHEQTQVCAAQIIFQPFSHIKIEMVGRLIQNQQVRLSDKGIGKRHALQLSTGKMLYLLIEVSYLQLGKNLLGLLLILPCFFMIHAHQDFVQTRMSFCFHAAFVLLYQFYRTVAMMETSFQNGQSFGILRVLFQISYPKVTTKRNGSTVIAFFSGNDIQQSSFTTAVFGNQSDTLPFGHTERSILKQYQITE